MTAGGLCLSRCSLTSRRRKGISSSRSEEILPPHRCAAPAGTSTKRSRATTGSADGPAPAAIRRMTGTRTLRSTSKMRACGCCVPHAPPHLVGQGLPEPDACGHCIKHCGFEGDRTMQRWLKQEAPTSTSVSRGSSQHRKNHPQ